MESLPRVSCILVNWNGWKDTVECLAALQLATYGNFNVIVVDNGSTDDSVVRIRNAFPQITLLQSVHNVGFGAGNNIGIRHAMTQGASYLWLLNNDTKPAPDALSALVTRALRDPRIGAVGSVCYYADRPQTVQVWAGASVNLWIGYVRNYTAPPKDNHFDSIYGASMLLTRAGLDEVGLLDEGFFHYLEETELCLRLRQKGYHLAAAASSHVLHKVGASTGGSAVRDRYFTASGLRIIRLHSRVPKVAMLIFLSIRFVKRLARLEPDNLRSVWAGLRDYLSSSRLQKIR